MRSTSLVMACRSLRVIAVLVLIGLTTCSGPQPLSVAIQADHERQYLEGLTSGNDSPRLAFFQRKAANLGVSVGQAELSDSKLSSTSNPFDARHDPRSVSRGAVIYKYNCARCHGEAADGRGRDMPVYLESLDHHRFAQRFAVTLHGGAPKKWFRMISDGAVSETKGPDGAPLVMPPFKQALAKEQIWLVVTYLQSLDSDAAAK